MATRSVFAGLFALALGSFASAQSLNVIGWNVESGGADKVTVANRIKAIQGCDLWGLCEVQGQEWGDAFEVAAEDGENANFEYVLGTTGGADRLLVIYDADRFQLVSKDELHSINFTNSSGGYSVRSPLVVRLKETASGKEFLFMVNHLYRSDNAKRHLQGQKLNDWAKAQSMPLIAVGDYNFDWDLPMATGETHHDAGYDNMIKDGAWTWIRPSNPVVTQHSSYESILDFVFVGGPARSWSGSSEIIVQAGDFPDSNVTPDHRPVRGLFDMGAASPPAPTSPQLDAARSSLRQSIQRLEAELAALKAVLAGLGG